MYRDIIVTSDSGLKSYTVTDNDNIFNGYVSPYGVGFCTVDEDGYYEPIKFRSEYRIRKTTPKPSIFKRDFLSPRKSEYKYAFTERTSRVITKDKDVYYNAYKDRFISRTKTSSHTKVEYSLPRLIVW